MPDLRRNDPARRGDPRDRRPVTPLPFSRNAVPPRRLYTYRGDGHDRLTWWMDRPGADLPVAPLSALTRLQLLDVCEAIDGPGPEWYRERRADGAA